MKQIDQILYDFMRTPAFRKAVKNMGETDVNFPVTITYALERLLIIHTKLFMMEDMVRDPKLKDEQIGEIKRKIDILNGIHRPNLIKALGDMLAKAVADNNQLMVQEGNLKDYKNRN